MIHVRTSLAEATGRWQHNRMTHERHDVRDEDFRKVVDEFQIPGGNERVIAFAPDTAWDDFVAAVKAVLEPSPGVPEV